MLHYKKLLSVLLAVILLLCPMTALAAGDASQDGSGDNELPALGSTLLGADAATDEYAPLTGRSATEIVSMMGLGFNIGNTFDSTGGNLKNHETKWGNPVVTQELVDTIYDNGFDTVRIPITWMDFISKDGTYTVDPAYLARIREVVDYCYNDGLFVIINAHHESWINISTLDTDYKKVGEELQALWTQVATYFADYDQHLIFEGMNEPRMAGTDIEWTGKSEAYSAINYLNQLFVTTVRSNGLGHNDERCLMVTGYAAQSSSNIMRSIALPTYNGEMVSNLIISIHSYTPYEFCLTDKKKTFSLTNGSDTGSVNAVFRDIHDTFLRYGIPVIMGETGATNSGGNTEARVNWAYYTSKVAASYGIPIVLWDNGAGGSSGGECHQYILRKANNKITYPDIFDALHRGQQDAVRGSNVKLLDPDLPVDPATEGKNLSYTVNGCVIATTTNGSPKVTAPDGMKFLGWYTRPDYRKGTEFNGKTVPSSVSTVYGKVALASFKPYKTDLTPAALPEIEPRNTRPTPTPTMTPSPTPTEVITEVPSETVTGEATPVPTPTPETDKEKKPSVPIIPIVGAILFVTFGFLLLLSGLRKKK